MKKKEKKRTRIEKKILNNNKHDRFLLYININNKYLTTFI